MDLAQTLKLRGAWSAENWAAIERGLDIAVKAEILRVRSQQLRETSQQLRKESSRLSQKITARSLHVSLPETDDFH